MSNQPSKEESRRFQPRPNTCGLFDNTRDDRSDLTGQIHLECPHCHATSGWWVTGGKRSRRAQLHPARAQAEGGHPTGRRVVNQFQAAGRGSRQYRYGPALDLPGLRVSVALVEGMRALSVLHRV
jgi:hypothetical protein